ncbi:MAG TPA: hypothetical protein VD907_04720 [Verrucomicrobiae bacterium]|nr:hypothetical protein [Verrucomicrobiae bacterium]
MAPISKEVWERACYGQPEHFVRFMITWKLLIEAETRRPLTRRMLVGLKAQTGHPATIAKLIR